MGKNQGVDGAAFSTDRAVRLLGGSARITKVMDQRVDARNEP